MILPSNRHCLFPSRQTRHGMGESKEHGRQKLKCRAPRHALKKRRRDKMMLPTSEGVMATDVRASVGRVLAGRSRLPVVPGGVSSSSCCSGAVANHPTWKNEVEERKKEIRWCMGITWRSLLVSRLGSSTVGASAMWSCGARLPSPFSDSEVRRWRDAASTCALSTRFVGGGRIPAKDSDAEIKERKATATEQPKCDDDTRDPSALSRGVLLGYWCVMTKNNDYMML